MSKALYVGIAGKARKVKKIYNGIGSYVRKVKKSYVGISDRARSGGANASIELSYINQLTSFYSYRYDVGAATTGNYAVFYGGYGSDPDGSGSRYRSLAYVEMYNSSFVYSRYKAFSNLRRPVGTKLGNYAFFYGGAYCGSNSSVSGTARNNILVMNNSGANVSTSVSLSEAKWDHAVTNVSNYAIFTGGNKGSSFRASNMAKNTYSVNTSLATTTISTSDTLRCYGTGATVGAYGIIAGGAYATDSSGSTSYLSGGKAYNSSLSTTSITLSVGRHSLSGANATDYALFVGGYGSGSGTAIYKNNVDAYNTSLVKAGTVASLPVSLYKMVGISSKGCATFAGGYGHNGSNYVSPNDIYIYTPSLVRSKLTVSTYIGGTDTVGVSMYDYIIYACKDKVYAYNAG